MGRCVCPCDSPVVHCDYRAWGNITCDDGTISRRDAKTDIAYLGDAQRRILALRMLDVQLATYRYKTDPPEQRRRLGFIIDDLPEGSHAVESARTHVDLYGYASMLLATIQEQQKAIERLESRLQRLEHAVAAI
jgi:hypothetical protein